MEGDDSAEQPGKHFRSCYALASSSHGVSASVSQTSSLLCSFSFITTLHFSINTTNTFLENQLSGNIITLKGKSIGKAGKFD